MAPLISLRTVTPEFEDVDQPAQQGANDEAEGDGAGGYQRRRWRVALSGRRRLLLLNRSFL